MWASRRVVSKNGSNREGKRRRRRLGGGDRDRLDRCNIRSSFLDDRGDDGNL